MYLTAFLLDCAAMAGFTVVPFFVLRQLGGGARMVGTICAAQAISYALGSLVSSRFVGRAKNGLNWARVGILGFAFLFGLAPLLRSPYLYGVVSTAGTGCMALVWPALWSWLGAEPDVKLRTRRISNYNVCWSMGLSIGPLFSGPLYTVDYRLPFLCVFAITLIAWTLVMFLPHEKTHFMPAPGGLDEARAAHDEASEAHLYYAWFANMLGWILVGACRSVFAKRVDELVADGRLVVVAEDLLSGVTFAKAAIAFSWLVFTINFSRLVLFFLMGRTHRWHYRFWFIVVFQIAAAVAMWRLGITRSFAVMVLCCFFVGVNSGVGFFAAVFYSLSNPARKHQRAAINESMVGGGSFLGSMGFGILAGWYGVTMPFRWCPVIVALGIIIQWGLLRYSIQRNRPAAGRTAIVEG